MEKDTYPVSKIIWNIASVILLIGFIVILFYIFYKPYYKLTVNDNFIGYYKDYNEFENLYNSIEKEYEEEGIKVVKYLPNNPLTEKTYVKESFVKEFDNKKLIEEQLLKDYTIYQVLVNNEIQFHTKTKEEADALVSELKNEVNSNSPVYAVKEGTVLMSCWNGNYGYQVKIKHSNGVITTYAHNNKLLVKKGQNVVQGQIIARSGSTGNSTGPHLHIEFIINEQFVNPQNYI